MSILIYVLAVALTTVSVRCEEDIQKESPDMVNICYQETQYDGDKLRDLSWENRRFTCFHACMMEQRGEMQDGKVNLVKYIENHVKDYNPHADEDSKVHLIECALEANDQDDKCNVAGTMGKCVTDKWHLIVNGAK